MFKVLRYCSITLALIALINILPHIVVRLFAHSNAVKAFETSTIRPEFTGTIKIATYNIAHGRGGKYGSRNWTSESKSDRESRLKSIASFLNESDVDIVILNEVDFHSNWSHNQNQAEIIARHANFPYRVEQRNYDFYHPFFRLQFGNAVLSKYPIDQAKFLEFTPLSKLEKLTFGNHDGVVANLRLREEIEISIAALHLEVRDSASRLSTYGILEELITRTDVPTILAGDLNSEMSYTGEKQSTIDKLSSIDGVEYSPNSTVAGKNHTFPSENPTRTLDWILAPPGTNIIKGEIPKVAWSDHLPLIVEIEL